MRHTSPIPDEENTLLNNVLEYCQLRHVLANHQRPAQTKDGWRTTIAGDEGFFDLTIVGPSGIILAELKRRRGAKYPKAQKQWADMAAQAAAHCAGGVHIMSRVTFDNVDALYALIDKIAKHPPRERPTPPTSGQELVASAAPLPPRPSVAPPTPPPASGALGTQSIHPMTIVLDGEPIPGMAMAEEIRRQRRAITEIADRCTDAARRALDALTRPI
jgi:hypothetical protein